MGTRCAPPGGPCVSRPRGCRAPAAPEVSAVRRRGGNPMAHCRAVAAGRQGSDVTNSSRRNGPTGLFSPGPASGTCRGASTCRRRPAMSPSAAPRAVAHAVAQRSRTARSPSAAPAQSHGPGPGPSVSRRGARPGGARHRGRPRPRTRRGARPRRGAGRGPRQREWRGGGDVVHDHDRAAPHQPGGVSGGLEAWPLETGTATLPVLGAATHPPQQGERGDPEPLSHGRGQHLGRIEPAPGDALGSGGGPRHGDGHRPDRTRARSPACHAAARRPPATVARPVIPRRFTASTCGRPAG